MDAKKYLIASIVAFVVYSALAYLVEGVILQPDYRALGPVLRSAEELRARVPLLYLSNLIFALAFCLVYVKGYEPPKPWAGQGLRFGLIMWVLLAPIALVEYVAHPIPFVLTVKWITFGFVEIMVLGLVVAALYRTQS